MCGEVGSKLSQNDPDTLAYLGVQARSNYAYSIIKRTTMAQRILPRTWREPFIGIGQPSAGGGVTTRDFKVEQEPLVREKVVQEEVQWRDNYKRSGRLLTVRAEHITAQGMSASRYNVCIIISI